MNSYAQNEINNRGSCSPLNYVPQKLLQKAYDSGRTQKPICVYIPATLASGEPTIAGHFARRYPAEAEKSGWRQSVVLASASGSSTLKMLALSILKALNDPCKSNCTLTEMTSRIELRMAAAGTKLLIIDQLHQTICGDFKQMKIVADFLNTLIDRNGIAVAATGPASYAEIFKINEQIGRRLLSTTLHHSTRRHS